MPVTRIVRGVQVALGTVSERGTVQLGVDVPGLQNANTFGNYEQTFSGPVVINNDLTVNGTITYINSDVVDIKDRVVHFNYTKITPGTPVPAPTLITGFSVCRGDIAGVYRDFQGLYWIESSSRWKFLANPLGDDLVVTDLQALEVSSLYTNAQNGVDIKPYGAGAGQTGELRFNPINSGPGGPFYSGFKAPDLLFLTTVWTLPVSDGNPGEVLTTDGFKQLSWSNPLAGAVTGTGTQNVIPKWNSATPSSVIADSSITDNGTNVTILQTNTDVVIGGLDVYGRSQIWDRGVSSVFRMGANTGDSDPTNINSDGIVVFQPTPNDYCSRMKANRFGLTRASDTTNSYYFRVDDTQLFYRANPPGGTVHFNIDRATGAVSFGPNPPTNALINIGTSGFAFNLAIVDPIYANIALCSTDPALSSFIGFRNVTNTASLGGVNFYGTAHATYPSHFALRTSAGSGYSLGLHTNGTERVHITTAGYVGIANTAPVSSEIFGVTGDARVIGDLYIDTANTLVPTNVHLLAGASAAAELRFYEPTFMGTDYVGFKAPDSIGSPVIWKLPSTDGAAGQALVTDSAAGLGWATFLSSTPNLSSVLAVGNTTGSNNILVNTGQQIDAGTAATVLNIGNTNASALGIGNALGATSTFQVFINQGGASWNSNAGMQFSSTVNNRAQFRGNQFGNSTGIAGITGFKSRGAVTGAMASVLAGDVLFRATAIGVTGNNTDIPLAGALSVQVATGGVFSNYLATDFEVALVSLTGGINSMHKVARITSEAALELYCPLSGPTAPVSSANTGHIRYNDLTKCFETSVDTGPWSSLSETVIVNSYNDALTHNLTDVTLDDNSTYLIEAHFLARRTDLVAGEHAGYIRRVVAQRYNGGFATFVGVVDNTLTREDTAAWDSDLIVTGADNKVYFQVTGTAVPIDWRVCYSIRKIS